MRKPRAVPASFASRWKADRRLCQPNVLGTAFGLKIVREQLTEQPCYAVFVKKKKPRSRLQRSELIPDRVQRFGRRLPTDVVEVGTLVFQAARPITDRLGQGTLSCFATSGSRAFGVSCAHALWGLDRRAITRDEILIWSTETQNWVPAGLSAALAYEFGSGTPADFGFLDAGLFELADAQLSEQVQAMPQSDLVDIPHDESLIGVPVVAESFLGGRLEAQISHIFATVDSQGTKVDLVIRRDDGGDLTRPGDSGMLWRTENGAALGIHALGEDRGPLPSPASYCCFAARAAARLNAELKG